MTNKTAAGEDYLAHFGVLGMHWGIRKDPESRPSNTKTINEAARKIPNRATKPKKTPAQTTFGFGRKKINQRQRDNRTLAGLGIVVAGSIGARVAVQKGAEYLLAHPETVQRAANKVKGTKAIGVGYDVVKLSFKNERWA